MAIGHETKIMLTALQTSFLLEPDSLLSYKDGGRTSISVGWQQRHTNAQISLQKLIQKISYFTC